jgi:hypothetical protein
MVIKRIVTFEDDTETSVRAFNNQMTALRTALATRFAAIADDESLTMQERDAAKRAKDAVNNLVFNKYDIIKSENARKIYNGISRVRIAYSKWLLDMRSKKSLDAQLDRDKKIKSGEIGSDELQKITNRQISVPGFLELINNYIAPPKPQLQKEAKEDQDTEIDAKASPGESEKAEVEKEKEERGLPNSSFSFDQSKLPSQREFLHVNKEEVNGQYVDIEWPTVVLEPKMAFYNAERSKEALMSYIAPIFEAAYYLNAGAIGYFGKDIEEGLLLAQKSVQYLQKNLMENNEKEQPELSEGLKRDELDDMIDELFK